MDRRVVGGGLVRPGWAAALLIACAGCGDDAGTGTGGAGGGAGGAGGGPTTSSSTTSGGGGSGGEGGTSPCAMLPQGPIEPTVALTGLDGSEDLAFDGKGNVAARQGGNVVLVDATGQATPLVDLPTTTYGMRYRPDGALAVALPQQGQVIQIAPDGTITDLATGLGGPNGVYPDFDGNVWVTEFGGNRVSRINADATVDTLLSGAPEVQQPNGILYDPMRSKLFYTNYGQGKIMSLPLVGTIMATEVITIDGAALDGLVLDVCGNLYVVDNGGNQLFRVRLDPFGTALGDAHLLATFPENVANAQFGAGAGFDPETLYVAGTPGTVYAVPVGVTGAPVPTAP